MEQVVTFFSQGQVIFANLGLPFVGSPCVIMSHGMEGSKDGKKWLLLASRLYQSGFSYLRFNYRGCGEGSETSEGKFEDTTLSGRIQDYRAAIDFVNSNAVDSNRLAVVGSSLGGMVAIAAHDVRIKAMVTLATPCRLEMPSDDQFKVYQDGRFLKLSSGRRLKRRFFTDIKNYNLSSAVGKIGCPILIIHGSADEFVPLEDAHYLYEKAKEPKRLEIIEGASHGFDESKHLEQVISLTLDWLKQYL